MKDGADLPQSPGSLPLQSPGQRLAALQPAAAVHALLHDGEMLQMTLWAPAMQRSSGNLGGRFALFIHFIQELQPTPGLPWELCPSIAVQRVFHKRAVSAPLASLLEH